MPRRSRSATSRSPRRASAGLACAAALLAAGGCGDDAPKTTAAPATVDRQVRRLFADYTHAVAARDFATACSHLTPDSISRMRTDALKYLKQVPRACPALFRFLSLSASRSSRQQLA